MHQQLAVIQPIVVPACVSQAEEEIAAAVGYALQEKSEGTRRAYASDRKTFTAWCDARGLVSLPAEPGTVARFLSAQADGGLKASTIGRRAAAIAYFHRLAGFEAPTSVEAVRAVMRGIRRVVGTAPVRKQAATADLVMSMLANCSDTLTGKRDRALLALGFAGAFRRSELVALEVADLAAVPDGLIVTIRRAKNDQEGAGRTLAVPRGCKVRPVAAVEAWLAAAGITEGPIFRPIAKGGRVQSQALSGHSVAAVVKKYAESAGLDPSEFAGHSLRSGLLTSAAEAGAGVFKLLEISGHASVDMLAHYVRRADLFKEHAGAAFL